METTLDATLSKQMAAQCMVLKTRMAARAVTRRYNRLLEPYAIQSTQASLLFAIAQGGFSSISDLAELIAMERSALSRNLGVLRKSGWVTSDQQGRGRAQQVRLTKKGRRFLESLLPLWQQAQDELHAAMGEDEWRAAQQVLSTVSGLR